MGSSRKVNEDCWPWNLGLDRDALRLFLLFLRQVDVGPISGVSGKILSSCIQPAVEEHKSHRERSHHNGKVPTIMQKSRAAGDQGGTRRELTLLQVNNQSNTCLDPLKKFLLEFK